MIDMWNERYAEEGYAYGTAPNVFFSQMLTSRVNTPGQMLLPAEGQGRNAVFAAKLGWEVDAFDISKEGKKKADQLALEKKVSIHFQVGTLEEMDYIDESFDAIGLIFAHFPPLIRSDYHQKFIRLLKPGGYVILEAFSKKHLQFNKVNPKAGGPKNEALLLDTKEVEKEFHGLHIHLLEEREINLSEGAYHVGNSAVVRFLGQKL